MANVTFGSNLPEGVRIRDFLSLTGTDFVLITVNQPNGTVQTRTVDSNGGYDFTYTAQGRGTEENFPI
jgi:hypothetical protein